MKSSLLATVAALSFCALASNALADSGPTERWPLWYVSLQGGVGFISDQDVQGAGTGKLSANTGWNGAGAIGYRPYFGVWGLDNLRLELEEGYHNNRISSAVIGGVHSDISSSETAWSTMGNAYFDFRNDSKFTPYVGAGAGFARMGLDRSSVLGNNGGTDTRFAYQFLAGIAYAPTTIPLTEWTLGYRYFAVQHPEFGTATTPVKLGNYDSNDVQLGARFEF